MQDDNRRGTRKSRGRQDTEANAENDRGNPGRGAQWGNIAFVRSHAFECSVFSVICNPFAATCDSSLCPMMHSARHSRRSRDHDRYIMCGRSVGSD